LRTLVSTFGPEDLERVITAMRALPYDRMVLVGEPGADTSEAFSQLKSVEEFSGHRLEFQGVSGTDFLGLVDDVSQVISSRLRDHETGARQDVSINISGGSKLLGDAALFAAFRMGVSAYLCDGKVVKLPVVSGATPRDRFTSVQTKLLGVIGVGCALDEAIERMKPGSRQASERVVRELKKASLIRADVKEGRVFLIPTDEGCEVLRALTLLGSPG